MRALILHPAHGSVSKPHDFKEFRREAIAFAATIREQGGEAVVHAFDNKAEKPARRRESEGYFAPGPWNVFAFFCHGLKNSIQTGHGMATADQLARVIAENAAPGYVRVELYACDAARDLDASEKDDIRDAVGGDGGFADVLRDYLTDRGVEGHVDAHAIDAHTTWNPYVRRFHMGESAGAEWLVPPTAPPGSTKEQRDAVRHKWSRWRAALRGPMRFRFPWLTPAEIDAAL